MIIFVGEISLNGQPVNNAPPSDNVKNGVWQTLIESNTSLHVCDFSPSKGNFLNTEQFALAISGQPTIKQVAANKHAQLNYVANAFITENTELLNNANGVFCGFILDKTSRSISLFTDYLGFRQIYLYRSKDHIIFSNAYWLIKSRIKSGLTHNIDGIVELGTLGYPLANRTQVNEIELLPPAQVMKICPDGQIQNVQYFDLTETQPNTVSDGEAVEELHMFWRTAVEDRCVSTTNAFGFLSGGMDSRLLTHTLKSFGVDVFTANFAPLKTRDRVFGEMSAHAMQLQHFQHPSGSMLSDVLTETVMAWQASHDNHQFFSDSPVIWSGDGGSVGLGHVYLTDEISQLASNGNYEDCAKAWCRENRRNVPSRLYRDPETEQKFHQRIAKLLEGYGATNPERAPYYFLMLNDQRRHLDKHYEIFHLRGFDLHLPFFDKRLITYIASLPTAWVNYHRIYDKLFRKISGSLVATPWQTYPNHVPCPLTAPSNLKYQWSESFHAKHENKSRSRQRALLCLNKIFSKKFPSHIFNRGYLGIASISTLINLTDHSYLHEYINPGFISKKQK
jgi:asparagine synthase (glutamine-hydrolysing)